MSDEQRLIKAMEIALPHIKRCTFDLNSLDECYRKLKEEITELLENRDDPKEVIDSLITISNLILKLMKFQDFDLENAVELAIELNEKRYLKEFN